MQTRTYLTITSKTTSLRRKWRRRKSPWKHSRRRKRRIGVNFWISWGRIQRQWWAWWTTRYHLSAMLSLHWAQTPHRLETLFTTRYTGIASWRQIYTSQIPYNIGSTGWGQCLVKSLVDACLWQSISIALFLSMRCHRLQRRDKSPNSKQNSVQHLIKSGLSLALDSTVFLSIENKMDRRFRVRRSLMMLLYKHLANSLTSRA